MQTSCAANWPFGPPVRLHYHLAPSHRPACSICRFLLLFLAWLNRYRCTHTNRIRKPFSQRIGVNPKPSLAYIMRHFIFRWLATTLAVMVAASIIHGIRYDSAGSLIGAALLLGILNAFVRPVLLILSAPLILVTLGFFILIINGLLLLFVPNIVTGFHVDNFWSAFWGAIVIGIVSWILSAFFRGSDGRVHVLTHHTQIKRVHGRVIEPGDRS
jgi:putative membrane protein